MSIWCILLKLVTSACGVGIWFESSCSRRSLPSFPLWRSRSAFSKTVSHSHCDYVWIFSLKVYCIVTEWHLTVQISFTSLFQKGWGESRRNYFLIKWKSFSSVQVWFVCSGLLSTWQHSKGQQVIPPPFILFCFVCVCVKIIRSYQVLLLGEYNLRGTATIHFSPYVLRTPMFQ